MLIGVPKESRAGETLVAATPDTVGKLIRERRYHQRRLRDLCDRDNKIKDIIWS